MIIRNKRISAPQAKSFLYLFLLLSILLFFSSCKQPFTVKDLLDDPVESASDDTNPLSAVAPLVVTPPEVTLYIGSSITFYTAGGTSPYTYAVSEGGGSITEEGEYTAPDETGTAVVLVTDADSSTIESNIIITDDQVDADYIIQSITHDPVTASTGTAIAQSFTLYNQGSEKGAQKLYWYAYLSRDNELDGTDTLVDSGSIEALPAGTESAVITIDGNWPVVSGEYYLIIKAVSGDDSDPSNNSLSSQGFTIIAGISDIDYIVTGISRNYPTAPSGSLCSETFDIMNAGGANGTAVINWAAYASADQIRDGGDSLIGSGTSAFSGLASEATYSGMPVTGSWPSLAGEYYLLVEISSADETITDNNSASEGVYTLLDPPDYYISNITYLSQGTPSTAFSASSSDFTFTITEKTGNTGGQTIGWEVFISTDTVLDGGDLSVLTGYLPVFPGGTDSDPISFSSGTWPAFGADYYIIVNLFAGDDSDSTNNLAVTVGSVTVPETCTEEGDNSHYGPTPTNGALTLVSDLNGSLQGNDLDPKQLLHVSGTMDAPGQWDTYEIRTGDTLTTIELYITWVTNSDAINFYLWDTYDKEEISDDNRVDSEPLVPTPPAKYAVSSNETYYIGVYFAGVTDYTATPYTIYIRGK